MRFALAVLAVTVLLACGTIECPAWEPSGPPALKVVGTHLTTPDGKAVRLRGVNMPSLEWGQGEHLFQTLGVAIDDWHVNIIRLPLSQDRWFGHSKEKKDGGVHYRKTVHEFVDKAAAARCYVIVDLHWSDAGDWGEYVGQHKMPDDKSIEFWSDAATAFANHPAVLFGLYNEPYHISWDVWRNGGMVSEDNKKAPTGKLEYHTPGIQKLLGVCRAKGAKNVAVAGGLDWGYDLSGIAKGYALADPAGRGVVYDTHFYPSKKDWDKHVSPTAAKYPVLVGELGDGPSGWLPNALTYIDKHQLNWIAWCLHRDAKPCLIKDWNYTPTAFGEVVKKSLGEAAAER